MLLPLLASASTTSGPRTKTQTATARVSTFGSLNRNLIDNGLFDNLPTYTANQTSSGWWNGTASPDGTDNGYHWRLDAGTNKAQSIRQNLFNDLPALFISHAVGGLVSEVRHRASGYATSGSEGVAIKPATQYTVSYWIKAQNVSGSGGSSGAYAQFLTVDSASVGAGEFGDSGSGIVANTSGWVYKSFTFTSANTAARGHLELRVYDQGGAGTLKGDYYFAQVQLTEVGANIPAKARISKTVTKTQSALARVEKSLTKTQSSTSRTQVTRSGGNQMMQFGTGSAATAPQAVGLIATNIQVSYTFRFRIDTPELTTNRQIFSLGGDRLDVNLETNSNKIFVWFYDSANANHLVWKSASSYADAKVHQIIVNKTATSIDVYMDGVFVGNFATTLLGHGDPGVLSIGNANMYGSSVGVWTRSLTSPEIAAMWQGVFPATNLALKWMLNDGYGATAADTSGNSITGTLSGGPSWANLGQIATARVLITGTKTQTATARISKTQTKTQTAVANIVTAGAVTKTQTATARIQATVTRTQSALARISINATRTQTATARVQKVLTRTQPATARVTKTLTATQTASARISLIGTRTQTATARVRATLARTQPATASIIAGATPASGEGASVYLSASDSIMPMQSISSIVILTTKE